MKLIFSAVAFQGNECANSRGPDFIGLIEISGPPRRDNLPQRWDKIRQPILLRQFVCRDNVGSQLERRVLSAIFVQLAMQRTPVNAEDFGGARFVPAGHPQRLDDVFLFEFA
jgi:hypothetical protein